MPWYMGNSQPYFHELNSIFPWGGAFAWVFPVVLWSVFWTGLALWHAVKRDEKGWFVFFLFIHTAGILEILYLLFIVQVFTSQAPQPKKRSRIQK